MINIIPVNLVAVLLCGVASMAIGFIWYSKAVFGKRWMELSGMSMDQANKEGMVKTYSIMFLASLIMAYILSLFIWYAGAFTIFNGAKTGLWAFLGFVVPTSLANQLFGKKSWELYLLDMGYHLVALLSMGAIISLMGR